MLFMKRWVSVKNTATIHLANVADVMHAYLLPAC